MSENRLCEASILGTPRTLSGRKAVAIGVGLVLAILLLPNVSAALQVPVIDAIDEAMISSDTGLTWNNAIGNSEGSAGGTASHEPGLHREEHPSYAPPPCFPSDLISFRARVVSNLSEGIGDMGAAVVRVKAYLIGGMNEDGGLLDTILEFDPVATTTRVVYHLPAAIYLAPAVALDDKVYILGGIDANSSRLSTIRMYDPIANTSLVVGNLPEPRFWGAAAVAGEMIYYGGGIKGQNQWADDIFRFDPKTGESVDVGKLPLPTAILTATSAYGKVYFIGGNTFGGQSNAIVEYDPEVNTTTVAGTFPPPDGSDGLEAQTSVTLNGEVYIFNGWDEAASPKFRNEIYRFDPLLGKHAVLMGTLPLSVERGGAVAMLGRAYLFGGYPKGGGALAGITEFIPETEISRFPRLISHAREASEHERAAMERYRTLQPPWACPTTTLPHQRVIWETMSVNVPRTNLGLAGPAWMWSRGGSGSLTA